MSTTNWKTDKGVLKCGSLQPAKAVLSVPHVMHASPTRSKTDAHVRTGASYGGVVSMARILVAGGVRDRAIERAVRAAAAAAAADAATRLKEEDDLGAASLPPVSSDIGRPFAGKYLNALPPVNAERGLKGSNSKRASFKDSGVHNASSGWEPHDLAGLQVRSIHFTRSSSTLPSPSARWQPSPSSSPLPAHLPPLQHAPPFKQIFRFADNDLSAPFRQDVAVKRPTLHVLAPADVASEKLNGQRSVLLQQTLQHSNLLGPGHAAAASTLPFPASSSMSNVLGAAVRNISLQKLSVQPGSSIKRNFALS